MKLLVKDAARLLDVSEKTIYRWIKQGSIPAYRVNEQYRFNRAELLEWATARRIRVSPEIFREEESEAASLPDLTEALAGRRHPLPDRRQRQGDACCARSSRRCACRRRSTASSSTRCCWRARRSARPAIGDGIAIPHVRNPVVLHVERPIGHALLPRAADRLRRARRPAGRHALHARSARPCAPTCTCSRGSSFALRDPALQGGGRSAGGARGDPRGRRALRARPRAAAAPRADDGAPQPATPPRSTLLVAGAGGVLALSRRARAASLGRRSRWGARVATALDRRRLRCVGLVGGALRARWRAPSAATLRSAVAAARPASRARRRRAPGLLRWCRSSWSARSARSTAPATGRPRRAARATARRLGSCYGLLLAACVFILLARDGVAFLVAWEVMALATSSLVTTEEHDAGGAARRLDLPRSTATSRSSASSPSSRSCAARPAARSRFDALPARGRRRRCAAALFAARARRLRHQGRRDAAPRLAARGARRRAQPRLGADVGRRDQDGHLRPGARHAA